MSGSIRVVSKRLVKDSIKADPSLDDHIINIDRPNVLGNPCKDGSRNEKIAYYEQYLEKCMTDPVTFPELNVQDKILSMVKLVKAGRRVALQCWCAPLPCHGDVIEKMVSRIIAAGPICVRRS